MEPVRAHHPDDLTSGDTWWHQCPYCPLPTQGGAWGLVTHLEFVHPDDPPPAGETRYFVPPQRRSPRRLVAIPPDLFQTRPQPTAPASS